MTLSFKSQQLYYAICAPLNRSVVHYLQQSLLRVLDDAQQRYSKQVVGSLRKGSLLKEVLKHSAVIAHDIASNEAAHLIASFEVRAPFVLSSPFASRENVGEVEMGFNCPELGSHGIFLLVCLSVACCIH